MRKHELSPTERVIETIERNERIDPHFYDDPNGPKIEEGHTFDTVALSHVDAFIEHCRPTGIKFGGIGAQFHSFTSSYIPFGTMIPTSRVMATGTSVPFYSFTGTWGGPPIDPPWDEEK